MTKFRFNKRKRTAQYAFDDENMAASPSSHQSAFASFDTPSTLFFALPITDTPPLNRFVAGGSAQLGGQPTTTCLGLFTSAGETTEEPPRPLKRRKVHSSSDMSTADTNDTESCPNEIFGSPSASLFPNGPTCPPRPTSQDILSTFEQDQSISSPTTVSHATSSEDVRGNIIPIEPAPATTEASQGDDFVVANSLQSVVSPSTLRVQPQTTPLPRSPYREYSDEEWARLSRHQHLLPKVNSESAAYAREMYARHKEEGFQIDRNYGLRKFQRNIPSRFAKEALTYADPVSALGTQPLPADPAGNNGHVGLSRISRLNRWRRRVTKVQKYSKKSRWAFFPTITGQDARQVKGDCYRVNTLLLNFGCWLRDESLWETVKSSASLRPVEQWWEANKSSGGVDTATECGDEGGTEDGGWESMEEEEEEEELPEEDEEEERRALME